MSWKRNVVAIWASQFLSIGGFAFSMPYAPFYIQELGITDDAQLKMWVALYGASAPLGLAIASPIWGVLADRFGRRIMLLRANFAAVIVLYLMSRVPNVQWLIVCRLLQGFFTGTLVAAQTMVAAASPAHRSGLALGGLSSAVFSGAMAGVALGGLTAEVYGFRAAFLVASLLLAAGGLLVLLATREAFEPPAASDRSHAQRVSDALDHLRPVFVVLLVVGAIATIRQFDHAFIALWVQKLHGSLEGASARLGILGAACCVAGFLSGIYFGRLADRMSIPRLGKLAAVGAAVFMLLQAVVPGIGWLLGARWGMTFFAGGLEPVIQAWLAKTTSPERRGLIFGFAASARSIGWCFAALISGTLAASAGLRSIFIVGSGFFLLLVPLITAANRSLANGGAPPEPGSGTPY